MTKYILLILIPIFTLADAITLAKAVQKPLGEVVTTNAQIVQLSNQQQKIVSRLAGHVENYFVKTGDRVRKGDKVALIESIALSQMTADFVALRTQAEAAKAQLVTTQTLYKKGLASKDALNEKRIALQEILAKQNALASQLHSLGIDPQKLQKATDKYLLHAHADGVVGEVYVPLHANVGAQTPLMSVVSQSGYYAVAYLGMQDAMKVTPHTKGFVTVAQKSYATDFVQLMPKIDEETQRAKLLFKIQKPPKNLLIDAFVQMEIALEPVSEAVMVKKSALSLFNGEWVVFVPVEAAHEEEHKAHAEGEHEAKEEHGEEEHEHEHHEAVPYAPKVVKIVASFGDEVAVKGIGADELYVAEGVYFVKSMLLKSALGEHGH